MIIDLHTHTTPRSEDSDLRPEALILNAKRLGLDGICFTEHDWHWKEEDISRLVREYDFPIFRGMEISSDDGHLLVFGLAEYKFGLYNAEFVRKLADEIGGAIILAHPFRRQVKYNSNPEQLLDVVCENHIFDLVDAVEVLNGRSTEKENSFAGKLCRRLDLKGVGGSDAHRLSDIPSFATEFDKNITCVEELVVELREGRYRAVDIR